MKIFIVGATSSIGRYVVEISIIVDSEEALMLFLPHFVDILESECGDISVNSAREVLSQFFDTENNL